MRAISIILSLLLLATPAYAVRVADITRLDGQRTNVVTGIGLVFGLRGTGNGGDYMPAIRPLAEMLGNFSNAASVAELSNVKNVALVSLTAYVPRHGTRRGDQLDLYVNSIGAATSLKGGRLFVSPMFGPVPGGPVLALAQGQVNIDDNSTPTSGVIRGGVIMEEDLLADQITPDGTFTLIIDDASASWATASLIAKIINDSEDGQTWAIVIDARNVLVTIPPAERERPDSFIARVQQLQLPRVVTEARVTINERTGTIIMGGDVEISPAIISHRGLTITTVRPEPIPTPGRPLLSTSEFLAIDPSRQGGAKLRDLLNSLDQLRVPAEDRIAIVKELHRIGKLHAKLIIE